MWRFQGLLAPIGGLGSAVSLLNSADWAPGVTPFVKLNFPVSLYSFSRWPSLSSLILAALVWCLLIMQSLSALRSCVINLRRGYMAPPSTVRVPYKSSFISCPALAAQGRAFSGSRCFKNESKAASAGGTIPLGLFLWKRWEIRTLELRTVSKIKSGLTQHLMTEYSSWELGPWWGYLEIQIWSYCIISGALICIGVRSWSPSWIAPESLIEIWSWKLKWAQCCLCCWWIF